MGSFFPVFKVAPETLALQAVAARRGGAAGGAASRPCARRACSIVDGLRYDRMKIPPLRYTLPQPVDEEAHHAPHRGRNGARGVRVRGGPDARCGAQADAGFAPAATTMSCCIRRRAQTEIQSACTATRPSLLETLPEVARGKDGAPLVSKESIVLIATEARQHQARQPRRARHARDGVQLRPQVKVVDGRMFRPGTSESSWAAPSPRASTARGDRRDAALRGTRMDGGRHRSMAARAAFDSEIWGDVDQLLQAFRRSTYSSVLVRLASAAQFEDFRRAVAADQRLIRRGASRNRSSTRSSRSRSRRSSATWHRRSPSSSPSAR